MKLSNKDADKYKFGFNGQEKVNEIAGIGNHLDFKFRGYDSRIARFTSVDPLAVKFPWWSAYQFAGNSPIGCIDLEGSESSIHIFGTNEKNDQELIYHKDLKRAGPLGNGVLTVTHRRNGNADIEYSEWDKSGKISKHLTGTYSSYNLTEGGDRGLLIFRPLVVAGEAIENFGNNQFGKVKPGQTDGWEGKAGWEKHGKHWVKGTANAVGLVIGVGEVAAAVGATTRGIAIIDALLTADDLAGNIMGSDATPLEKNLSGQTKSGLSLLKFLYSGKNALEGARGLRNNLKGEDFDELGKNIFQGVKGTYDAKSGYENLKEKDQ